MTHTEKLEAVRQACIEANPDIEQEGPGTDSGDVWVDERPVRLADVLLAVHEKTKTTHYMVSTSGTFTTRKTKEVTAAPFAVPFVSTGASWNLRADDLSQQSEETVSFTYDLLS